MEFIYRFDIFINKINDGLIKTYDIKKTTEDIDRIISSYNIKHSLKILNNNSFELTINEFNRIPHLKETIEYILDSLFNLYGWFPSKMEITNIFGYSNNLNFTKDYLLNPSNNISDIKIIFESKFDKISKKIPTKLYHLSIQEYGKDILKNGILPKSKSKISSHDYDSRVYLCDDINSCRILINPMKIFYSKEKDSILYSGKNPNRKYNKNTKWIIFEIETNLSNIDTLYKDPNYINGYYCLDNITPNSIKIVDKE